MLTICLLHLQLDTTVPPAFATRVSVAGTRSGPRTAHVASSMGAAFAQANGGTVVTWMDSVEAARSFVLEILA